MKNRGNGMDFKTDWKKTRLFALLCLCFFSAACPADAVWSGWRVTSAAEKLLENWAEEGRAYRPKLDHIHLFCRAQLKYKLGRDDYLHRWYDRPLLQNSALGSRLRAWSIRRAGNF